MSAMKWNSKLVFTTSAHSASAPFKSRNQYWGDLLVVTLGILGLLGVISLRAASTTTTSLTLSSYALPWKTAVTLTAAVSNGAPVTTGVVTFCDANATLCENSAVLGTAQLTSAGTAVIRLTPSIGSHSYNAVFNGTSANTTSTSSTQVLAVNGEYPTSTAIASGGSAGSYTLTGTVVGTGNLAVGPTGTVEFQDANDSNFVLGSGVLGAATLAQGFATQATYTAGAVAPFVATGDFNGDGIPDVVIGTGDISTTVSVFIGNGDGTFQPAVKYATGTQPYSIAVGDFNNDGFLDLAVANLTSNSVSILLGKGDGTFQAGSTLLTGASTQPMYIVAVDLNGDGILDLVVANKAAGTIGVFIGNADGTFKTQVTYPVGTSPYSVTAFKANGVVDLAVANLGSGNVGVLIGKGDGTFPTAQVTYPVGKNPYTVMAVDVNNDGKADLVVTNSGAATVGVLIGVGDGTFNAQVTYPVGTTPYRLAAGDLNRDGKVDLVVANYASNDVSVLLGNGDGTFETQVTYPTGNEPFCVAIADFNGDGLPDLAIANRLDGTLGILLNSVTQTATASISNVSIPGTGTHNVYASYQEDEVYDDSTSTSIPLTASIQPTALTLTANQSSDPVGQPIVLTASLNPSTLGNYTTASETITFKNGATTLGTAPLNSLGIATLALPLTTTNPVGAQAVYPGDSNFAPSTSNTLTSVIMPVLTVTAYNASYVSGSGNLPSFTYSISGFINGDTQASATRGTPSLTTAATSSSPVGTYPIIAALGTLTATNYSFAFENASLTITSSSTSPAANIQGRWEFSVTSGDTSTQFSSMGQATFSTYLMQASGSSSLINLTDYTTDTVACDTLGFDNVTVAGSSIDGAGNVIVNFTVTNADLSTFNYVFTGVLGIGPPQIITGTFQRSSDTCNQGHYGINGTPDGTFTATFFPDLTGTWNGNFDGPDTGSGPTEVPATFTLTTNADKSLSGTISVPTLTNGTTACLAGPVTLNTVAGLSQEEGSYFELYGTDGSGTQVWVNASATNPDGSIASVGEDDPADGTNGTMNDGTNNQYTALYGITGGPCDGMGGGDAPFKLVKNSTEPPTSNPKPPRRHHGNPYHRYHKHVQHQDVTKQVN